MAEIPQKLFFRIGEVCDLIQVQPHVLRYWETEFPTLAPQKNRAGQRVYRRKDVEMVMRIRDLLYVEKFTIAGARKRLIEESKRGGAPKLKPALRDKVTEFEKDVQRSAERELDIEMLPDDFDDLPAVASPVHAAATTSPPQTPPPTTTATTTQTPTQTTAAATNLPATQTTAELPPRTQRALRVIKHELEGLLTLLDANATLKRSI